MIEVVPPYEPYISNPLLLLALCIWRESRGEIFDAKLGVAWTVRNRCNMAPAQGFKISTTDNILHPGAFSSFNRYDPNSIKYPVWDDPSWIDSQKAAQSVEADPTVGSVFYFSAPLKQPPRAWGPVEHGADIGSLHFYRIART
jgi:spore germination cell wall hydrolase CwlJ-like protein